MKYIFLILASIGLMISVLLTKNQTPELTTLQSIALILIGIYMQREHK